MGLPTGAIAKRGADEVVSSGCLGCRAASSAYADHVPYQAVCVLGAHTSASEREEDSMFVWACTCVCVCPDRRAMDRTLKGPKKTLEPYTLHPGHNIKLKTPHRDGCVAPLPRKEWEEWEKLRVGLVGVPLSRAL